jgi:ssRNA-specific RNase YbeY (16S rRNA maturation enzyme)
MTYLFLAVPPYSGSTVLHNYIAKCSNVVTLTDEVREKSNRPIGIIEGNAATGARRFYGDIAIQGIRITPGAFIEPIQDPSGYDWTKIKEFLDANWEAHNPNASVRLQKTPNDTYRVQMMQQYFDAKWIIMVRNPYAWLESTIEKFLKRYINPSDKAEELATHIINTYAIQKYNKEFLGDNGYTMTLEDFVANEDKHTEALKLWMPELSDLTFKGECLVKSDTVYGLSNNNDEHIELLHTIPGAIDKFNTLFRPHEEILNYWGYELI